MWLSSLCIAVSLCLGLVEYGAEATRPLPTWARIAATTQHGCTMVALYFGYTAYVLLAYGHEDAKRHVIRQAGVFAVTFTAMLVPAVLADPDDFTAAHVAHYDDAPVAGSALSVFTAYAGFMVTATAAVSWRWSRLADEPWIRRGLLVGTAGLLAGALYFFLRAMIIVLAVVGHPVAGKEGALIGWLIAVSVPLSLAGLTVPGWGPRLSSAGSAWRMYHAHRRLHPLWTTLTDAVPHVRMSFPRSRLDERIRSRFGRLSRGLDLWTERWSPFQRHLDLRLHLRVVQIWDARRALLGHCDEADYERALTEPVALRLPEHRRAAHAEAAMLAAALHRYQTGHPRKSGHTDPSGVDAHAADLSANVAWLQQVAKHLPAKRPAPQLNKM